MTLTDAHNEWATRPADERFWNLTDLHNRMLQYKQDSRVVDCNTRKMRVEGVGEKGLVLCGENSRADFTYGSFGQLCSLTGLPAGLMRDMPGSLVAQNLNWGLQNRDTEDKATKSLVDIRLKTVRGFNSGGYGRIYNADVTARLKPLLEQGWRGAPARPCGDGDKLARPATPADVLENIMPGLGIKVGDMIAPAGFYGDADKMFVFMVNERATIRAGNVDLCRGFFITNAETPGTAEKITTFLYGGVCGNHYVWDAQQVIRSKVVHKGQAEARAWRNLYHEIEVYSQSSAIGMENRIKAAQRLELGKTKDEVIEVLWNKKISTKGILNDAYGEAVRWTGIDGHDSPRTVWGMMGGMTRLSQQSSHADKRVEMDQAASKILAMAPMN